MSRMTFCLAVAVAERGGPSIKASSPKARPAPMVTSGLDALSTERLVMPMEPSRMI